MGQFRLTRYEFYRYDIYSEFIIWEAFVIKKIATILTLCVVAVLAVSPVACSRNSTTTTLYTVYRALYDRSPIDSMQTDVHVMDSDGGNQTKLTERGTNNYQPQSSPDGSKIAYVSNASGNREIHVMNADGSNSTKVTTNPEDAYPDYPQWSPSGNSIAYSSSVWGQDSFSSGIYTVGPDGTGQMMVVGGSDAFYYEPVWSPDGNWISYVKEGESENGIYKVKPDGTGETTVVSGGYFFHGYGWSPDGQWIVFSAIPPDGDIFHIYKVSSGGGTPTNLTDDERDNKYPQWSPSTNAGWIAYQSAASDGTPQVYKMKSDGSEKTALTDNSHYQEVPVWHPGGEWIYYARGEEQPSGPWIYNVWRVKPDGTGAANMTNSPAQWYSSPTWLPVE